MEMRPRVNQDSFVWVEEVRGELSNRSRNRVVRVGEGPPRSDVAVFRSIYVSDGTLPEYVRAYRGPGNPSGISGFRGPCTARFIPFDIDREQGATKQADWPAAINDARRLIEWLKTTHGVDPFVVWCSLTGGRGVHIYLPAGMFGGFEPAPGVPEAVKAIAARIGKAAGVTIDEMIYDRTRLLRLPNTRHKSGKYCVPVLASELLDMKIPDLVWLMDGPRPNVLYDAEVDPIDSLVELRKACEQGIDHRPRGSFVTQLIPGRREEIVALLNEKGIEFNTRGHDIVITCPTGKHADRESSLGIDTRDGKFHCFGCGEHGNWEDCKRLLAQAHGCPRPGSSEDVESESFHRSDTGNARLFARLHGKDVRFDFRRGRWLIWTGHCWAPDADGRRVRMAEEVARKRYEDAWNISDKEQAGKAARFAISSENRTRVRAMLELARSQPPIADKGRSWDADPMLLGVPNGIVDLCTGELRNGRRGDRVCMQAGVGFKSKASCDRWLQFLDEVFAGDRDLIEYICRAVGYSITGDVGEQCLFLLHGVGANGKSTFLNAIRHAVGDYGYNMPFTTIELDRRSSIPNDVAALVGRRLVTASETNEATRLNEGRVKALTGGDPVTARFLNREFFTYRPVAKFWLAVNHKPRVTDDSHGFWRRVRLIPFTQQFPGDKMLESKLKVEAPGILRWAVEGCRKWQERGLDPPDCVKSATEDYRQESDVIAGFIAECIEVTNEDIVLPIREIVEAYNRWADREGLKPRERLGSRGLRSRLKARWEDRHRGAVRNTPARYVGLRLRESDA